MITKLKLQSLEEKCDRIKRSSNQGVLFRLFTYDGRPMGKDGHLLDKKEIALLQKQEDQLIKDGGSAIKIMYYYAPKIGGQTGLN